MPHKTRRRAPPADSSTDLSALPAHNSVRANKHKRRPPFGSAGPMRPTAPLDVTHCQPRKQPGIRMPHVRRVSLSSLLLGHCAQLPEPPYAGTRWENTRAYPRKASAQCLCNDSYGAPRCDSMPAHAQLTRSAAAPVPESLWRRWRAGRWCWRRWQRRRWPRRAWQCRQAPGREASQARR